MPMVADLINVNQHLDPLQFSKLIRLELKEGYLAHQFLSYRKPDEVDLRIDILVVLCLSRQGACPWHSS